MILQLVVKPAVLGVLGMLCYFLAGRCSAALKHRIALFALLAMLAAPLLQSFGPSIQVSTHWASSAQTRTSSGDALLIGEMSPDQIRNLLIEPNESAAKEQVPGAVPLLPILWSSVGLFLFARVGLGLLLARAHCRGASRLSKEQREVAARAAEALGLRARPKILITPQTRVAMTWGVFRPKVLLPQTANEWSEEDLFSVLAHEFAHIHRGDWLAMGAASFVSCVFWFNPFAWILAARLRQDAEAAADDLVLSCGVPPQQYAHCLLELARQLSRNRNPIGVASVIDPSQVEVRIKEIMKENVNRRRMSPVRAIAIALLFAALTVPIAALKPAQGSGDLSQSPAPEVQVTANGPVGQGGGRATLGAGAKAAINTQVPVQGSASPMIVQGKSSKGRSSSSKLNATQAKGLGFSVVASAVPTVVTQAQSIWFSGSGKSVVVQGSTTKAKGWLTLTPVGDQGLLVMPAGKTLKTISRIDVMVVGAKGIVIHNDGGDTVVDGAKTVKLKDRGLLLISQGGAAFAPKAVGATAPLVHGSQRLSKGATEGASGKGTTGVAPAAVVGGGVNKPVSVAPIQGGAGTAGPTKRVNGRGSPLSTGSVDITGAPGG